MLTRVLRKKAGTFVRPTLSKLSNYVKSLAGKVRDLQSQTISMLRCSFTVFIETQPICRLIGCQRNDGIPLLGLHPIWLCGWYFCLCFWNEQYWWNEGVVNTSIISNFEVLKPRNLLRNIWVVGGFCVVV